MNLQIVQSREDALLGHAQAACHHGKKQTVVRLERRAEHCADQVDHSVVIAMGVGLVQRHVVLVDQQNGLLTIVLFEERA